MPFNPDGSFTLAQEFGTGVAPDNQLPPKIGDALDDIAAALDPTSGDNPYLAKANNLSDVPSIAAARTNLGLAIGVNVQAFDAQLSSNIPGATHNENYTLALTDGEKYLYHGDSTSYTWTLPSNAGVAFPLGTAITFVNEGTGTITIAITSDTLKLAGSSSTGSRTLKTTGMATALKITSTVWFISGSALT